MVSTETKKKRRKAGQKRKKAERVEVEIKEERPEQDVELIITGIDDDEKEYAHFKEVFAKMQQMNVEEDSTESEGDSSEDEEAKEKRKRAKEEKEALKRLSKKEQRRCTRLTVAQLKQAVSNPAVVEPHDANTADPRLLIFLKSLPNSVPIPRHWCQKRKYLSRKGGFTKPPFELPSNIAATGISRIREAYLEREEAKRQKSGDKTRAKVSRIDIDYHVLQDAFFKHQVKPPLSSFGEMYFEGREKEYRNKNAKPGVLSEKLRRRLGMPEGYPPPWLINMQKYGPPPSYPGLAIPGLNAPLPPGASWGYKPGGWGKAPVDANAVPLYGDVFGKSEAMQVDKTLWGQLEDYETDEEEPMDDTIAATIPVEDDIASTVMQPPTEPMFRDVPSQPMLPIHTEAPDIVDLRKADTQAGGPAFQVLEKTSQGHMGATSIMGTNFGYKTQKDVDISLSETDISRLQSGDTSVLREKYDANNKPLSNRERAEVSEAFSDELAKRQKKEAQKKEKKRKEFKF
eukprot:TRINITY_DN13236_c0_g1_i1.p1 TRINITY_DN13236_c0_g1~~TRINITY_DN13236_c0_g1_i1.p1  ORF type:complete len:514 (+),score=191.85 TRINITY_DN13236_c0_g1_i1:125-1666(+)